MMHYTVLIKLRAIVDMKMIRNDPAAFPEFARHFVNTISTAY